MQLAFAFCLLLLTLASGAHAETGVENQTFSGTYELLSCTPDCSQIVLNLGLGITHKFGEVDGFSISVLDQLDDFWETCDGQKAFEYNVRIFGRPFHALIPFMSNNIKGELNRSWKVCDGKFSTSPSEAILESTLVQVALVKGEADSFQLTWANQRLGFSGVFHLRKVSDRP